jgi:clan AA aspartic protease
MIGYVDGKGRALISVSIRLSPLSPEHTLDVWIDTGFNGDLVMPQPQIDDLKFPQSGTVKAVLADGSEVTLLTHTCYIDWFDASRQLEVIANDGDYPLLGVGLLLGRDLHISYRSGEITID